ncbi:MAG: tetratricopeptide repeat protein [Candidatus Magasanikbacteria bacterium]|nr:tetratricopeptide repeat protein [Candidatus Magasanikbacteria bacterium]
MFKQNRWLKISNFFSYFLLILNIIIVPFVLDPTVVNPYLISKEYLFIGFVLLNILLWTTRAILSKKLLYIQSVIDKPILFLLGAALLSAFFSVTRTDSFLGRNDYFAFHFILLFFLALFFVIIIQHLNTIDRWRWSIDALVISGGAAATLFFTKTIFHFDILARWFPNNANMIDSINGTFGVWLIALFLITAGQLIKKDLAAGRTLLYFFTALLSFLSLIALNFTVLWWLILLGLVLLLLVGVSALKEARLGWLSTLFATFILVIVFIVFGTPKPLQSAVPAEASLSNHSSWVIASRTLVSGVKNVLLGSGLGTFGIDFSRFRDVTFNADQYAWSFRFNRPFSSALGILSEGGSILSLIWLFLILFVIGHILTTWIKVRDGRRGEDDELLELVSATGLPRRSYLEVFLAAVPWCVVTIGGFVVFYGLVLWWLWWFLLGMIIAGLALFNSSTTQRRELIIEDTPEHNLSFSFILIVVISVVCIAGVWGARLYLAEERYSAALKASGFATVDAKLREAAAYRDTVDLYHVALAQNYLLQAISLSRQGKPDLQQVSAFLGQAINEARRATDLSPRSVAIWENLATMYENAAVLVPDARDWAVKSLTEAETLEPTNPVLAWRLGNNYSLAGNWPEAIKSYEQSISLKKDYVGAYIGLANAYEQTKEIDKAVAIYAGIAPVAQNDVDYLYNFGRLLYNRNNKGDRDNAEKVWLEVIKRSSNHSNALYSLGLLYEQRGNKLQALEYYYKVKGLNPDNKDIGVKINSLIGQ